MYTIWSELQHVLNIGQLEPNHCDDLRMAVPRKSMGIRNDIACNDGSWEWTWRAMKAHGNAMVVHDTGMLRYGAS